MGTILRFAEVLFNSSWGGHVLEKNEYQTTFNESIEQQVALMLW